MKIKNQVSLKNYNTFGVHIFAKHFAEAHSVEELQTILTLPLLHSTIPPIPVLFLGGAGTIGGLFWHSFGWPGVGGFIAALLSLALLVGWQLQRRVG